MQVSLTSAAGSRPNEGSAGTLVLPRMLQLLDLNAGPQARRAQAEANRADRLRRRDSDHEQALAQVSEGPRASDELVRAERKMLPGSNAARRQQVEQRAGREARAEDTGFREALAGARQRPAESKAPAGARDTAFSAEKQAGPSRENMAVRAAGDAAKLDGQGVAKPSSASTGPTQPNLSAAGAFAGRPATAVSASVPNADAAMKELKVAATAKVAPASGAARGGAVSRGASPPTGTISPPSPPGARSNAAARGGQTTDEPGAQRAPDANTERILRTIHFRLGEKRSTATLRMDPPELGNIKLHVELREAQLSLRIEADSGAARQLLTEQRDVLRHGLEASGIQLERFEVRAPEAAPGDGNANRSQHEDVLRHGQQESAQRDTHSAGGGSTGGTEATTVGQARDLEPSQTVLEPATESLVNVWA